MLRLPPFPVALIGLAMACGGGGGGDGTSPGDTDTDTDSDTDTDTDTDTDSDTDTDTDTDPTGVVGVFGTSQSFVTISAGGDGLDTVRDLAFNPLNTTELWTVNQDSDGTVLYFDPGEPAQTSRDIVDPVLAEHFMEEVSAIAFANDAGNPVFATCQESRNTYNDTNPANDFMGPTLWPNNLAIYGVNNQAGDLGWHLDMLHQSPLCMGIEWEVDNAFWVFDGSNGNLVRYDFADPHCIGCDDHSDGIIRRHTDVNVLRTPGVPSHIVRDPATGVLYIADTGNARVLAVDPSTATRIGNLNQFFELLDEYTEWNGATVTAIVTSGLTEPSGIALAAGVLFVSDHANGDIVAYDLQGVELGRITAPDGAGVMGLEIGPDGKLWYVDGVHDIVVRVDPIP